MTALWQRWTVFTGRQMDSRPLHLVRVFIALAILGDLGAMARRDVLPWILYPGELGGLVMHPSSWYLFEGAVWAGPALWVIAGAAGVLVAVGVGVRPAMVVLLLAYAQLGHLYIPGDRGIDRLLRTVMLLLIFSGSTGSQPAKTVAAWPADLIRWLLMIVYLSAGVAKFGARPGWHALETPELYQIVCSPTTGRLDGMFWYDYGPLFALGGVGAIVLELSAVLLVTRFSRYWAVLGALLHIGLIFTVELGMFPFGMLALYPVLFGPWTGRMLDRLDPWLVGDWRGPQP
jgi:hypothetical protein